MTNYEKFQVTKRNLDLMQMLTTTISHEMMAPLNCIKMILSGLLEKEMDDPSQRLLKIIQNSTKLLFFYMKQLLDKGLLESDSFKANY